MDRRRAHGFDRIDCRMRRRPDDGDADARVGHVKGRPGIGEADVEIKEQKIDDMTVEEAVGQVAENTGEKKTKRNAPPWVARVPELTAIADIKLNQRHLLRRRKDRIR